MLAGRHAMPFSGRGVTFCKDPQLLMIAWLPVSAPMCE